MKNHQLSMFLLCMLLAFGGFRLLERAVTRPAPRMPVTRVSSYFAGTVLDPEGKPAPGVLVSVYPYLKNEQPTDKKGRFALTLDPYLADLPLTKPEIVVARDLTRNLATTLDLGGGMNRLDLKLEPAWTLAGRVVDANGAALPGAEARAVLKLSQMTASYGSPARADAEGRFEIKALPVGRRFSLLLTAIGFAPETSDVEAPEGDARRVELEAVQLLAADQRIAGMVLDDDDKAAAGAWIGTSGNKQPQVSGLTDAEGRFAFTQLCAGPIQVSASTQRGLIGRATVEGGDTNITIRAAALADRRTPPAPPPSLEGQPLPDLAPLGLTANEVPVNQRLLAVLLDVEQRPSKRVLKRLIELADLLKGKGVAVVVLQAGALEGEAFAAWKTEAALPFPVGLLKGNRDKTRASWGAAALPWLILTDANRKVTAEGFAPGELEEKLALTGK